MTILNKDEYEALFEKVKDDLQALISNNIQLDKEKNKLITDFYQIEKIWEKHENWLLKNGHKIKCLMFCEYPINPKNYIYSDADYIKILRQKRIVIFDLIPFTVKYRKNLVKYFAVLKKCSEYWKQKFFCLRTLIDESTNLFLAYKRMHKLHKLNEVGFNEIGFDIGSFKTFDTISASKMSLKSRIDEYTNKYANHG